MNMIELLKKRVELAKAKKMQSVTLSLADAEKLVMELNELSSTPTNTPTKQVSEENLTLDGGKW